MKRQSAITNFVPHIIAGFLLLLGPVCGQSQPTNSAADGVIKDVQLIAFQAAYNKWKDLPTPRLLRAAEDGDTEAQVLYWDRISEEEYDKRWQLYYAKSGILGQRESKTSETWQSRWKGVGELELRKAAGSGDESAQFCLDELEMELAVKRAIAAFTWVEKAADKGYAPAECEAGLNYLHLSKWWIIKPDHAKGMAYLERAVEKGFSAAEYQYGCMQLNGHLVVQDISKAIDYLQRAADKGGPRSQNQLARLYENGNGIPRGDYDTPVALYRKSAKSGNYLAMRSLADRYRTGWSVPVDYVRAIRWNQAEREAMRSMNEVQKESVFDLVDENLQPRVAVGAGLRDFARVLSVYLKATERNDGAAMVQLGDLYMAGKFVPKSKVEAYRWYNRAADHRVPGMEEKRDRVKVELSPEQRAEALKNSSQPEN